MTRRESARRRTRRLLASFGILLIAVVTTTAAAAPVAFAASPHQWSAVLLNGRDPSAYTTDHPLSLVSGQPVKISVSLTNRGDRALLSARSVRFQGGVLGLDFVRYETRVDLKAAPGTTDTRSYRIDLVGLDRQATGLLPARIQLVDNNGRVVDSRSFVIRVHGSLWSAYGILGLTVTVISVLLLAGAVAGVVRGRQHRRRLQRALTFAAPGVGVGTLLLFVLSATAVVVPIPVEWIVFLVAGGLLGLAAGLGTPSPYRGGHEAVQSHAARSGTDRRYSPLHSFQDAGLDVTVPQDDLKSAPEPILMSEPVRE